MGRWTRSVRAVSCAALAALAAACGGSHAPDPPPAAGGPPCAGQPPGCGSRAATLQSITAGRWSRLPAGPLRERTGEVAAWTGRQLLLWGGQEADAPGQLLADGATYDPGTGAWERLPASPLSGRRDATAVWDGHDVLVWGGDDGADRLANDGASYDPATRTWRRLPPGPLPATAGATMVWTGTLAVVFGGLSLEGQGTAGAAYDPATGRWQLLPAFPPGPAGADPYATAATWAGDELVAIAAYEQPDSGVTRTVAAAWRPGWPRWARLPSPPPGPGMYGVRAAWTGWQVLLVGAAACPPGAACTAGSRPAAFAYTPSDGRWAGLPPGPALDADGPVLWTGRCLVEMAGRAPLADSVALDPLGDRMAPLRGLRRGVLPDGAVGVWTGRELLVWAGYPAPRAWALSTAAPG